MDRHDKRIVAGRYLGCNRAFEDYIGVPRESLIGKTVADVATEDVADLSMRADQALLESSGAQTYETSVIYARDGSRHDVLMNKATFYTPGEKGYTDYTTLGASASA